MKELTAYEGAHCANCQTPLQGEYCHHCGQSMHSVLRPVHGLVEEFFETFLHVDGRILHTLPALLFKPGFLTLEYFSGRRVRYIAPFRLMFVLCLLAFFAAHLATDVISRRVEQRHPVTVKIDQDADFSQAKTADEVQRQLDRKIQTLEAARLVGNPAIAAQVGQAEQRLRSQANLRLAELGAPAVASTSAAGQVGEPHAEAPVTPVNIRWLPDFANQRLTEFGEHIKENTRALKKGSAIQRREAWDRLAAGTFSALPGTMLVLAPVFAGLLSLFYLFKRRLYMEHLIVSLHSHAFLFLSLLLMIVLGMLSTWLKSYVAALGYAVSLLQLPLMLWVPAYLLIMQKRVYRQGWAMTAVKYWCIGWLYLWLVMFALLAAVVLGLAH